MQISPHDQFFFTLENNFNNVMGNRDAAYHFITQQLEVFKNNTEKGEGHAENDKYIQKLEKEAKILKNGINIQNKKISVN